MLDPGIVHERVFEKLLELTRILNNLGLGARVIYGEGNLEAGFTRTLPKILSIFLGLGMVKLTEPPKSQELLASRRLIILVDWCKEALNFSALIANDKASKAVLDNILVSHVQLVDNLSSMWGELLFAVGGCIAWSVFCEHFDLFF